MNKNQEKGKKEFLDLIVDVLNKKEFKAGCIILEVETGNDKTFKGIERIVADLRGDNKKLADKLYEESGHDIENLGSEFLQKLVGKEWDCD